MRRSWMLIALTLAVLCTAGTAAAGEPAAPTAAPDLPSGLFLPEPEDKYGMKNGPCSVAVSCWNGTTIRCSGQQVCYWKVECTTIPGFVECDGRRTTCVRDEA